MEKYIVKQYLIPAIPPPAICDQFAFRSTGSTTCALVYLMHHVTKLLETNAYVRCLLIDFSKAFDVIDHNILMQKLKKLCLPVNIYNWIVSFLSNRLQSVRYKGVTSDYCNINRGVIQGSGLGPTLFSIMISDLNPMSIINILCKYADDVNLLSPENTDVSIDMEFQQICQWALDNKMIINRQKTKEIVFHRPNPRNFIDPPNILLDIERVKSVRLLGITLTDNLKFDVHVKNILSQCSQRLYILKQVKGQGLPVNKLNEVFVALIVSKFRYALPAWGGFVSAGLIDQINGFFRRSFKYKFCNNIYTFDCLLLNSDEVLFKSISYQCHCLYHLLPDKQNDRYDLRLRGHELSLPIIPTALHKASFLNRCIFKFK